MQRRCLAPVNWLVLLFFYLPVFVTGQEAQRYDVIITELMADPEPPVGLPAVEFVELLNRSREPVPLKGWTLSDRTSTGTLTGAHLLQPGAFVILCASANVAALSVFGNTIGVTRFPSLDNAGDELFLKDGTGRIIHALAYETAWYREDFKKNGGWSLEMTDTSQPCLDIRTFGKESRNWRASLSPEGGSPGNAGPSMQKIPEEAPFPIHSYMTDAGTVHIRMNMAVTQPGRESFIMDGPGASMMPDNIEMSDPWHETVTIRFPLLPAAVHHIRIRNIPGCAGSRMQGEVTLPTALPGNGSLVINELLFNPRPAFDDYVELYNKGSTAVDLSGLALGGKNASGQVTVSGNLSPETRLLFPGEYIVLSPHPGQLKHGYIVKDSTRLIQLVNMPGYPDDKGTVLLFNRDGTVADEVSYHESWHHSLLQTKDGVPLEKIYAGRNGNDAANWHSSAGTPGYRNVQALEESMPGDRFFSMPYQLFTPDHDGQRDVLLLEYRFDEAGWILNADIYDTGGRIVKTLARQYLAGTSGLLKWDGVSNKGTPSPTGHYLLFMQYFHAGGKTGHWKKAVSIFRR